MKTIQISKQTVLAALRRNRQEHKKKQEEALKMWTHQIRNRLQDWIHAIDDGNLPKDEHEITKDLEKPSDTLQHYDDAIEMLDFEERGVIELTEGEFKQYMQDRWNWKENWSFANSKYLG